MKWIIIVCIVAFFLILLCVIFHLVLQPVDLEVNKYKQWLRTLDTNKLKISKYVFIKYGILNKKFSRKQLQENKFEKRPWICLELEQLSKYGVVIVMPQKTNHKKDKIYHNNVYFDDNNYYLDVKQFYIIKKINLTFINKNWKNSNKRPTIENYSKKLN